MKPEGIFRNQGPYVSTWGGTFKPERLGCYEGWCRYSENPLVHVNYGDISEPCMLKHNGKYYLFSGWDSQNKVTLQLSDDGVHLQRPVLGMFPQVWDAWEEEIGAPYVCVVKDTFHMWYTARTGRYGDSIAPSSCIVHAKSPNGIDWYREEGPCMKADALWEGYCIGYPSVLYENGKYRMWYSGGDIDIGGAIGYAESNDGVHFIKYSQNPVFQGDKTIRWEHMGIGAAQVVRYNEQYYMAYTAWEHQTHGRICFARSNDGIHWSRHPNNPIITGGNLGFWDVNYVSAPSLLYEGDRWRMWYTGHRGLERNIGCIIHEGEDLGFDLAKRTRPPKNEEESEK